MKRWFVTGTDTEIGKTYVSCLLIRDLVSKGHSVAAMKPVASGGEETPQGLRNEDALKLMGQANVVLDYETVNPYCYKPAIAPHIAAKKANKRVDLDEICRVADTVKADHLVIEGVGGWEVPLNDEERISELVRRLKADVILVVGMRLGCINHALLTANQIRMDGCKLTGWIANLVDQDMQAYHDNLRTLVNLIAAPLLAEIPFNASKFLWQEESRNIFNK